MKSSDFENAWDLDVAVRGREKEQKEKKPSYPEIAPLKTI